MKITRDAFLYLEGTEKPFAQCASCSLYDPGEKRCAILGPAVEVLPGDSCGFYVPGSTPTQPIRALVTPEQAGLVHRQVRCENCAALTEDGCDLFYRLNKLMPNVFNLDTKVSPSGCCNAQHPKGGKQAMNSASFARYLAKI